MLVQARADEFERLQKRLTRLSRATLASMVVAFGMAAIFFLGPRTKDAVEAAPGNKASGEIRVAKKAGPAPVVAFVPTPLASAARSIPGEAAIGTALPLPSAPAAPAMGQAAAPLQTDTAARAMPATVSKGDRAMESKSSPDHHVAAASHTDAVSNLGASPCQASGWYVQLGALRGDAHVRALVARSRGQGFDICEVNGEEKALTQVLAGPYHDAHAALKARNQLRQRLGFTGFLRRYEGRG